MLRALIRELLHQSEFSSVDGEKRP